MVHSTVPTISDHFLAGQIGISVERLVQGVFLTEIQLEKWMLAERRKQRTQEMDLMST
jgi:hypothetical protein